MSVDESPIRAWTDRVDGHSETVRSALTTVLFGDRLGLAVFLGSLCFAMTFWRLGIFITDNYTLANALVGLSEGHLYVGEATYGSLDTPGMSSVDGRAYGRNFGQLVFALPSLWALQGLVAVGDPGLIFAALWSLLVLAFAIQVGHVLGRPSIGAIAGSVFALVAFLLNVAVAQPLSSSWLPMAALQLSSMTFAAIGAVFLYRLVSRMHGQRAGVAVGAMTVAATPVGFWASIPKRHVVVTALVLGACYAFYRSRSEQSDGLLSATGFRAMAYAFVGLTAWIHAPEAFVLFAVLVVVDVPTAPANDRRTLAVVGAAFFVSLLPFFVTNTLISGNPLRPPRMLPGYGSQGGGSLQSGGGAGGGLNLLPGVIASPVTDLVQVTAVFLGLFTDGLRSIVRDPESLYRTFGRGGYLPSVGSLDHNQAINLTVLESAPLLAGLAGLLAPAAGIAGGALRSPRRFAIRSRLGSIRDHPASATDAFVLLLGVSLTIIYMPRLPLHAQVTVRYLLTLFPLCLYGLVRQDVVRRTLRRHGRTALWTWAGGVLIGCQLLLAAVVSLNFGRGEAVQLHAVLGLVAALVLAVSVVGSALDDRFDRATAVALGVAAALGTDLLLLSGIAYFQYGDFVLPATDAFADLLSVV